MLPLRRIVVHHPDADLRNRLMGDLRNDFGPSVPLLPAASHAEALMLARTAAPEVIILPLHEPGSTAIEILAQLRAEFPTQVWAVVVLLPDERPESLRQGLEAMRAGALDYAVGNPPAAAALSRAVRHAALRARTGRNRRLSAVPVAPRPPRPRTEAGSR